MKLVDVDRLCLKTSQTPVAGLNQRLRRNHLIVSLRIRIELRRDDVPISRNVLQSPPENRLAVAVVGGRVDQIDPQIQRALDHSMRLRLVTVGTLSDPTGSAGPKTHQRNIEPRSAQNSVLHDSKSVERQSEKSQTGRSA